MAGWMLLCAALCATGQGRARENYDRIDDGLWMGGLVAKPPRGVEAVLNLCGTRDSYKADVHVWEPITDAAPSLAWLRGAVEWVRTQKRAGRSVYVHCQVGISRSGMVVVATLMAEKGWTRDKALAFVRESRPQAQPTPAFMALLKEYEGELARLRRGRR